jgi:hypothetical protein
MKKKFSEKKDYLGWSVEEDMEELLEVTLTATELGEMIEQRLDNMPDRRTKSYKLWVKDVNDLMLKYNQIVGFKAYSTINDRKAGT